MATQCVLGTILLVSMMFVCDTFIGESTMVEGIGNSTIKAGTQLITPDTGVLAAGSTILALGTALPHYLSYKWNDGAKLSKEELAQIRKLSDACAERAATIKKKSKI